MSSSHAATSAICLAPVGWHDLATATHGRLQPANAWGRCERIVTDSREVSPGDIFWALRGQHFDGHQFVSEAASRGAALIVCQVDSEHQFSGPRLLVDDTTAALGRLARWHRLRYEAYLIGVTGSVGKTTTKELLYSVLSQQFRGLRSPGNYNNEIGLPRTLLQLTDEHEFAVCEMGAARIGDIRQLAEWAQPEMGIVTAISPSHLASFGSLEAIAQGKGELLEALPKSGVCILPGDDPATRDLRARAACRAVLVGSGEHNDLRAAAVRCSGRQLMFTVDEVEMSVALGTPHLLSNALCAVAAGLELGLSLEQIADGLDEYQPLAGRGAIREIGDWQVIDDSYNASPKSMEAALNRLSLLSGKPGARRYAVLGDMRELGPMAAAEHRRLGMMLANLQFDGLLAYGEHARHYAEGALQGGCQPGTIVATESLEVLQMILDCWLNPGDLLLVKGSRAMRMERVIEWLEQQASLRATVVHRQIA